MVSGVLFQGWNIGTLGNTLNGCVTQNPRVARCLKRILLSTPPPPNSSSCQDSDRLVYDSGSLSPSICWMLVCLYPPAVRDGLFVIIVQQRGRVITLYCVCSLPAEYDSMMVQCEQCDSWYHYRCVGIKHTNPRLLFVYTVTT